MADNTRLNAGTGGDLMATDEITGSSPTVKIQRVKMAFGAGGVATDVEPDVPLPVEFLGGVAGTRTTSTAVADALLLAANDSRVDAKLYNDANADFLVGEGATAVDADNYTVRLVPGALYATDFKGMLRGMFASAPTGKLRITETTS